MNSNKINQDEFFVDLSASSKSQWKEGALELKSSPDLNLNISSGNGEEGIKDTIVQSFDKLGQE